MKQHTQLVWGDPPETLELSRNEVHIWGAKLNQRLRELDLLERTLASSERARAERFRFERDRARFIAARGQLRMILGSYASVDPCALEFTYGPFGKPSLSPPFNADALKFNLSHSGELALIAVTRDRDLGVDVEEIRQLDDAEAIAGRFFSPRENVVLRALPEAERLEAFFHCWTCKEAYVKATGDGLACPTESFDVSFGRGEPARLLGVGGNSEEASRWSLTLLTPASGYVGAVAVEGQDWSLTCWQWMQKT